MSTGIVEINVLQFNVFGVFRVSDGCIFEYGVGLDGCFEYFLKLERFSKSV